MPTRKRFNAFEDFSEPETETQDAEQPQKVQPGKAVAEPQVERIERLVPSQMMPDRFQPRRLLPISIRTAFFNGEINCYKAALQWLEMGRYDPGVRAEVDRLLSMGLSFDEFGQIKPITGSWVSASGGRYIFQIETGERRFWAACLQAVQQNLKEEPQLRVEVIPHPLRQRQVIENRHAEPPSAVEQACEVSSLILAELGIEPDPKETDEFNFFRQARSQRMPAGLWDKIMPVMQLTRPRMVQLLNILQLPSPLLEIADRYRLPERVLREILLLPHDQWDRMIRTSVQHQLTSEDVVELAAADTADAKTRTPRGPAAPTDPIKLAIRSLGKFARLLEELDEVSRSEALDEIADYLVVSHQDQEIMGLLDELAEMVSARIRRR